MIAVAHGGWRGLVDGILEETIAAMPTRPEVAWLGPAIGADVYEVGEEVLDRSCGNQAGLEAAIRRGPVAGKGYLDLARLAELKLQAAGVAEVFNSRLSTWDTSRFYSYRREGSTGRMATLAWLSLEAVWRSGDQADTQYRTMLSWASAIRAWRSSSGITRVLAISTFYPDPVLQRQTG